MSIQGLYNTTAIYETFTFATDEYGQEVKTWAVSTYIKGTRQLRAGSKSIVNLQEGVSKSARFYCDNADIDENGRLVFSTIAFAFQGNASTGSDLSSTETGAMYFCASSFSTYEKYDYAIYDTATTGYIYNDVIRNNILLVNDQLRGNHMQIDLGLDYENRS